MNLKTGDHFFFSTSSLVIPSLQKISHFGLDRKTIDRHVGRERDNEQVLEQITDALLLRFKLFSQSLQPAKRR